MSSRQLRKLQRQRELEQLQAPSPANKSEDESEDDAPVQRTKRAAFSAFAALGGQDNNNDEDEDNDDRKSESTEAPSHPAESATFAAPSSKSKKKKKKGKKSKAATKSSEQQHTPISAGDEIDEALRELNLSNKKSSASAGSQTDRTRSIAYERICELLRINTHHLKVVNEMRNLFGRDAIAAAMNEENEERTRTQRTRHMQQQVDLETFLKGQPGKTLPEVTLRRNPFLPGKDTWPRASTGGLIMEQIKDTASTDKSIPGTVEFAFAHLPGYNSLEQQFFQLVQMLDPMQLVHFLYGHPYHISTLIQVSKVAKQDQNSALSADLCERALFTFGRVALSGFRQKMEEGKARLDFRRPENRQFWLAGYHYLKNLAMKGTYRTALEWAKLLFSMDLNDPYGMIHFIHPMAIRAHESKWFIDFCDSEILDNFDTAQDYVRQTLVLARLQQKDTAGAKALLIEGMERLPWLYSSLYKALNLDVPKAIWGMQPRDGHEELFVELYIYQTKSLWDNAQATGLLKEAAHEAKKPNFQTFGFPPVAGRNVARFVYLDNTPSLMGHVPGGLLSTTPNWEFDPIPPPKDENIFSYKSQQRPWESNQDGLRGFDIPQDVLALRQLLNQVRHRGAPPEFDAIIEEAMAEVNNLQRANNEGDDHESDEEGDAEPRQRVAPGLVQALMGLFNIRAPGAEGENEVDNEPNHDRWDLAESELENRMPGAWGSDSEDGMPALRVHNADDAEGDASDDEMPALERPT
ncbi:transcriptional repressor TCF25-domain-containing protein [Xylaria bambusicola]|uniref:transcriptional repressor TCF25-domain-containing protein n=1 Tax=Xylaria bambusicola TaxID=326684 RepID=UPI0020079128|nr:transcriptional repressor TCF25-domain-containing protein [Xylaria bambusicola]KAI0508285.1 transcriptional repressor TCF25-domain-containing protein [Xylaria bambusicola]